MKEQSAWRTAPANRRSDRSSWTTKVIFRRITSICVVLLRLGVEMLGFQQHADGVSVEVREREAQKAYRVMADYVIAADGADSPIRAALGIERRGVGHLRTLRSILFRCP